MNSSLYSSLLSKGATLSKDATSLGKWSLASASIDGGFGETNSVGASATTGGFLVTFLGGVTAGCASVTGFPMETGAGSRDFLLGGGAGLRPVSSALRSERFGASGLPEDSLALSLGVADGRGSDTAGGTAFSAAGAETDVFRTGAAVGAAFGGDFLEIGAGGGRVAVGPAA